MAGTQPGRARGNTRKGAGMAIQPLAILGTPLLLNFKILGGALPQTKDLIDACSL